MKINNATDLAKAQAKLQELRTELQNKKKFHAEKSQSRKLPKLNTKPLETKITKLQSAIRTYQKSPHA